MHTEPAAESIPQSTAGPIRAFKAPMSAGGAIDVLVWLEGDEVVVKELSSLVRPARGERRLHIDSIGDVELIPLVGEQLLTLSSSSGDHAVRLQGPQTVMQSFVRELAQLADLGSLDASPARPGLVGRVVSWLHGQ